MLTESLLGACSYATTAHAGQLRKFLDEPYILHPVRCAVRAAEYGLPVHVQEACLLHDVIEDAETLADSQVHTGTIIKQWPTAYPIVHAMTKWWNGVVQPPASLDEFLRLYYGNIISVEYGPEVKLIDRTDNLKDMNRLLQTARDNKDLSLVKRHIKWCDNYVTKTAQQFGIVGNACKTPAIVEEFARWFSFMSGKVLGIQGWLQAQEQERTQQ